MPWGQGRLLCPAVSSPLRVVRKSLAPLASRLFFSALSHGMCQSYTRLLLHLQILGSRWLTGEVAACTSLNARLYGVGFGRLEAQLPGGW